MSFACSNSSPMLSARTSFISFYGVKCWRSFFWGLTLESSCVLKFSIIKTFGKWSVIFSIILPLVRCISLKLIEILSTREGLFCSTNLVAPRVCRVNQLLVNRSRNSFTSLFLSKFSRLIFKSLVNITFLFSLESVLGVYFKYLKNSVSFCFGCLYTTPATKFSLLLCIISIHCASYSL